MSDNVPEFSVSELSGHLKRTIEDAYGYVRVRGEVGRVTRAGSGHCYLDLKDERAVLSSVVWKGAWARLSVKPEQGMEIIASGRLTTFPGQSRYQLVIDTLEPAGAGALMAMYEARRKALAEEGLFDAARKRPLPALPRVIGVVTSPSGAVIRDILHRLRDRFPCHVLVWPTLVQGDKAPAGIVAGIEGFGRLDPDGPIPRPDVLIVARGGGSLEDLWCFNDEAVVRAAAASAIPLISAVGHETDVTLIDFAADRRAPTPTAAAEMAVPVRIELLQQVGGAGVRLDQAISRLAESRGLSLQAATRGLGRPERLLETAEQRLDRAVDGLANGLRARLERARTRMARAQGALAPGRILGMADMADRQIRAAGQRLAAAPRRGLVEATRQLARARLPAASLGRRVDERSDRLTALRSRLTRQSQIGMERADRRLGEARRLLESLSYKGVLARGYALIRRDDGTVVRRADALSGGEAVTLGFVDGDRRAVIADGTPPKATRGATRRKPPGQPTLFESGAEGGNDA
jgi:exodeoxyribonuclease VII large subunit